MTTKRCAKFVAWTKDIIDMIGEIFSGIFEGVSIRIQITNVGEENEGKVMIFHFIL